MKVKNNKVNLSAFLNKEYEPIIMQKKSEIQQNTGKTPPFLRNTFTPEQDVTFKAGVSYDIACYFNTSAKGNNYLNLQFAKTDPKYVKKQDEQPRTYANKDEMSFDSNEITDDNLPF